MLALISSLQYSSRRQSNLIGVFHVKESEPSQTRNTSLTLTLNATRRSVTGWGAESLSAEDADPLTPLLRSSSLTSDTHALSVGSQSYHMTPLSSASPSLSSGFHSLSKFPPPVQNSLVRPIPSPPSDSSHADEDYEMMESPMPPELQPIQYREPVTQNGDGFVDVPGLRRAVRILEDRIVPLEKKVAEHQQLQALVRTMSLRISKLEKQLTPQSQSSTTPSTHMASMTARAANVSYLCSLSPSQVTNSIFHAVIIAACMLKPTV